jgi:hypothetical protein
MTSAEQKKDTKPISKKALDLLPVEELVSIVFFHLICDTERRRLGSEGQARAVR